MKRSESYQDMIARLYPLKHNIPSNIIQTFDCTFQVTDACNLKCSYCYQINKNTHIMPLEIAKQFINILLENNKLTQQYIDTKNSKAIILNFIGGEPLLEIELIDQICDYFYTQVILKDHPWQYYWAISISTNGTLYFNDNVQNFLKKWKKFLYLSISIDGNKELHDTCRKFPNGAGSYDLAIAASRHYRTYYRKDVGSKITLSPQNVNYTANAIISLINEGYEELFMNCAYEKGWNYSHAQILYTQLKQITNYLLKNNLEDQINISMFNDTYFHPLHLFNKEDNKNWCGGNGYMIAVDWKGDIYPCLRYMESSLGDSVPPIIIGNIYDGIMYNHQCKTCVKKLRKINRISQSTLECIKCPIAAGCSWCQAYNYQNSNGRFDQRAIYICYMHKAICLANCYFWNLYYLKHNENKRFKLYLPDNECLKIISKEELQILKFISII